MKMCVFLENLKSLIFSSVVPSVGYLCLQGNKFLQSGAMSFFKFSMSGNKFFQRREISFFLVSQKSS
jgi:hypothetical protein